LKKINYAMNRNSEVDNKHLYDKLKQAYSAQNLNNITAGIIDLYRSAKYLKIKEITRLVSDYIDIYDEKVHRCFSKLIMTYHPDKSARYLKEIDQIMKSGNSGRLHEYAHILIVQDIDNIIVPDQYKEDIDYHPEYMWDTQMRKPRVSFDDDLTEMLYDDDDYSDYEYESYHGSPSDNSFFSALKIRLYGTEEIDLPYYYLEEMEEIELAGCEIETLDGIEHCRYVENLDLSNNKISDITAIVNLVNIEELYLQNNQIGLIDMLYNLRKLRIIDLSGNDINDISPLFGLNKLEFVNLLNNPVPRDQINILREKDILVVE
jgi:Leucine-rich repeat (LRR) protein